MDGNNKDEKDNKPLSVGLNGMVKYADGKIAKSDYFNFIQANLDDYSHISFTPEEANKIATHMRKLSTGAYAMTPMFCAGPQCPFAARCPFQQMGKAPIGQACLIEVQLINHYVMRYMEEYDVDPNSLTETGYCNELAEIQILEMRLNQVLARPENATLVIDQVAGVDREGNPFYQKAISPYIEQKEKLASRRSKIIKLMVGDRQEQYKKAAALKVRDDRDASSQYAAMRKKIESLKHNMSMLEAETIPVPAKTSEITELEGVLTPEALFGK